MSPWEEKYGRRFHDALDRLPKEDVAMLCEMFDATPSRTYDDTSKSSHIGKLFHALLVLRMDAEYAAKVRAALDVLRLGR
jgi:hypothetical protein